MLFEMTAHDDADAVLASVDDDGEPLSCVWFDPRQRSHGVFVLVNVVDETHVDNNPTGLIGWCVGGRR